LVYAGIREWVAYLIFYENILDSATYPIYFMLYYLK